MDKKKLTVYVPLKLFTKLKTFCASMSITMSKWVEGEIEKIESEGNDLCRHATHRTNCNDE